MRKTIIRGIAIVFGAAAALRPSSHAAPSRAAESQEHGEARERAGGPELVDGLPVVRLARELQVESGLETLALQEVTHLAETLAYGEVVDMQPLLERRAEHHRTLAERRAGAAALDASRQDYERLRAMREQRHYVSEQELVAAEATFESDRARADGLEAQLADLRAELLQTWGTQLTAWALDGGSQAFDHLLAREQVLLLVTLRPGDTLPERDTLIRVGRGDDTTQHVQAELVSPAPHTDPVFQGETYYFRADAGRLRTGMRVDALIPAGDEARQGVNVPLSAVVWQGGRPWVYVQLDAERFGRRAIEAYHETGDAWFVSGVLRPGDAVVVRGAQMLLSEEFRWQIPDEDND